MAPQSCFFGGGGSKKLFVVAAFVCGLRVFFFVDVGKPENCVWLTVGISRRGKKATQGASSRRRNCVGCIIRCCYGQARTRAPPNGTETPGGVTVEELTKCVGCFACFFVRHGLQVEGVKCRCGCLSACDWWRWQETTW